MWTVQLSHAHAGNASFLNCKLGWSAAIEIWPDLSAAAAATSANETGLDVRQPHLAWPPIGAQSDVMIAMAIDQDTSAAMIEGILCWCDVNSYRFNAASCRT